MPSAVATVFFLATILIFWLARGAGWQAAGLGLTIFGLAGLVVDYFSQHRAEAYYQTILSTLIPISG